MDSIDKKDEKTDKDAETKAEIFEKSKVSAFKKPKEKAENPIDIKEKLLEMMKTNKYDYKLVKSVSSRAMDNGIVYEFVLHDERKIII